MTEGYGVDIVYLDYRKAYDSVNHAKLFEKLILANIDLTVIKWIASFLQGRTRNSSGDEIANDTSYLAPFPRYSLGKVQNRNIFYPFLV